MTTKTKKDIRQDLLKSLQTWHIELGIYNFPKRFGISTNEKKFREVSFRVKRNIEEIDATVEDVVLDKQYIYGMNHSVVGYSITYRVWLPQEDGKFPGQITIRFSLHTSVVAIVKIGDFFITVEHDYFPLQQKSIGFARMFGVTESEKLESLADIILAKEYPFLLDNIKSTKITQLGKSFYVDPSSRYEKVTTILIDIELDKTVETKEELAIYLDHRNPEMLLHHIYTLAELKDILKDRMSNQKDDEIVFVKDKSFCENYSLWALSAYFSNL